MRTIFIEGVRTNYLTQQHVVTLLDETSRRILHIWISQTESLAIAMGLTGVSAPRPLASQFTANLLKSAGVTLEEVRIESLKDSIFYAVAKIRNGTSVSEIDARPSDALALAVQMGSPIYVAEDLLQSIGIILPEGKTVDQFIAEDFLKKEGIPLPEGKTLPTGDAKERQREEVLNEIKQLSASFMQPALPTEEQNRGEALRQKSSPY